MNGVGIFNDMYMRKAGRMLSVKSFQWQGSNWERLYTYSQLNRSHNNLRNKVWSIIQMDTFDVNHRGISPEGLYPVVLRQVHCLPQRKLSNSLPS